MERTGSEPATVAIIGAGNRGADVYAEALGRRPDAVRIVAVADPDPARRDRLADRHEVPESGRFDGWASLLARPALADAVVIATPDALHLGPAREALARGYHLLLEKPIAPTLDEVRALAAAAADAPGTVTVAHVLRYAPFFQALADVIRGGRIGALVGIQHTENVGHWHFAHSYVRGNWRREADAAPMILAKACHDLDLLRWWVGRPCRSVASFGDRRRFRREHEPEGATDRCTDGCAVERSCPYSALRIYQERFAGERGWPVSVVSDDPSPTGVRRALETGPYGRCVYRCDNDVADHQVAILEFEGGVTANLTVSAFTEENTRTVHLMGDRGEAIGHLGLGEIEVREFMSGERVTLRVGSGEDGHGGGDDALVDDFVARLRGERTGPAASSLEASIESHTMAFAAERSRREGRVVSLASLG